MEFSKEVAFFHFLGQKMNLWVPSAWKEPHAIHSTVLTMAIIRVAPTLPGLFNSLSVSDAERECLALQLKKRVEHIFQSLMFYFKGNLKLLKGFKQESDTV